MVTSIERGPEAPIAARLPRAFAVALTERSVTSARLVAILLPMNGNQQKWLFEPAIRSCRWCSATFNIDRHKRPQSFCGRPCADADRRAQRDAHTAKRRAWMKGGGVDRIKVFKRDKWICWICDKPTRTDVLSRHPLAPEMDHVKALARGGQHLYSNVATAHRKCNATKRGKEVDAARTAAVLARIRDTDFFGQLL
jgi:5-methylcytosine-specific restriction endonuclease McrA